MIEQIIVSGTPKEVVDCLNKLAEDNPGVTLQEFVGVDEK